MIKKDLEKLFLKYQESLLSWDIDYTNNHLDLLYKFEDNFAFMRDCFDAGHFTASTFVVNKWFTKILLMHHIKFDRWQQFWGHADGEINLINVAKRELHEESWIPMDKIILSEDILELDIHEVPSKWDEPAHKHYDVRFLAVIDENIPLSKADNEVQDIFWFNLDTVISSTDVKFQSSMKNTLLKIKNLRK